MNCGSYDPGGGGGDKRPPIVQAFEVLKAEVPSDTSVDVPKAHASSEEIINDANERAETSLTNARSAIVKHYIQCEQNRVEQQKPLLKATINLVTVQIWLFNIIIFLFSVVVVVISIVNNDIEPLLSLFDFLKYYVGAVLVELLGMLLLIAKSIFSSNYGKIMELMFKPRRKGE